MSATITPGRKRRVEEAASYAVGHRIRIDMLVLLNEGIYSQAELAKRLGRPVSMIGHHVKGLLEAGCIEVAKITKIRNADQHFYRAVQFPLITDKEVEVLPSEVRQERAAFILQASMAESLGALWAGKMSHDPRARMMCRWFNVDIQGQQEIATELHESWERIVQIEARAINRCAKSGEKKTSMIVTMMGFERSQKAGGRALF